MQLHPLDSKNMISAADHGWDEQDQYESDKYKDSLLRIKKNLELLRCIQRAYLCPQNAADIIFSVGVDTNNVFPSIYMLNSVRFSMNGVQAQGSHTNMEENAPTTAGSVGCAGDESSALSAVPTSVHQQLLLNNPGGEGSDVLCSNHAPTITSSTEANRIPLVDQLTANQSQDKRISADDHGWVEQDQYESEEYEDSDERLFNSFMRLLKQARESFFCSLELPKRVAKVRHDRQLMKRKVLEDLEHNIAINKYFEWLACGRWDHFRKYPVQPLGMQGLLPLPDDHAYLRFHNKSVDFERFPCDGTFPVVIDINTYFSCSRIQTPKYWRKGSCICSVPFYTSTNKTTSGTIPATPGHGDNGFVVHSANSKRNLLRKNIFMLSRASDGGSSSEGTDFTLSGGNNHHRETDSPSNDMPAVILDSGAQANCTGNFSVLSNHSMVSRNVVLVAVNGQEVGTYMSGSVRLERFELHDVHYCPELGNRIIVSGSMLDNDDYGYEFGRGKCSVTDLRSGRTVGEGCLLDGHYVLNYLKIPRDRTPGLVTRMWNAVCSALHRLGLNPQGPPM